MIRRAEHLQLSSHLAANLGNVVLFFNPSPHNLGGEATTKHDWDVHEHLYILAQKRKCRSHIL